MDHFCPQRNVDVLVCQCEYKESQIHFRELSGKETLVCICFMNAAFSNAEHQPDPEINY